MSPAHNANALQLPLDLKSGGGARSYHRREPETTVLHAIVREHLEPFLQHARETYSKPIPKYVEQELRGYLKCGLLRYGFARVRCPSCRHAYLVAFSCKSRTLCPSCATRRMAASAAHIAYELRGLLAANAKVLSAVMRIFGRVVSGWYERVAGEKGATKPKTGGILFPQRFGGSLNLHVHVHSVFVDGAYRRQSDDEALVFVATRAPSQTEIAEVAAQVGGRVVKWLRRHGYLNGRAEPDVEPTAMEA